MCRGKTIERVKPTEFYVSWKRLAQRKRKRDALKKGYIYPIWIVCIFKCLSHTMHKLRYFNQIQLCAFFRLYAHTISLSLMPVVLFLSLFIHWVDSRPQNMKKKKRWIHHDQELISLLSLIPLIFHLYWPSTKCISLSLYLVSPSLSIYLSDAHSLYLSLPLSTSARSIFSSLSCIIHSIHVIFSLFPPSFYPFSHPLNSLLASLPKKGSLDIFLHAETFRGKKSPEMIDLNGVLNELISYSDHFNQYFYSSHSIFF